MCLFDRYNIIISHFHIDTIVTPTIATSDPNIYIIVGMCPRMTAFKTVYTMEFVLIIALVGPAKPYTIALSPMILVNIRRKLAAKLTETLYRV